MPDEIPHKGDAPAEDPLRRFAEELTTAIARAERRSGRIPNRAAIAARLKISAASLYAYLNGTTLPRAGVLDRLLPEWGITGEEAGRLSTLREAVQVSRQTGRRRSADGAFSQPRPRQLPVAHRHFTGRGAELERLKEFKAHQGDPSTAAVTVICGTAGVGKTALALHWAHRIKEDYRDGQLYANLRGFDTGRPQEPGQVLDGFLRALGVTASAIPIDLEAKTVLYRSLLGERHMLIFLDNARSAEYVRPLLPGSGHCLVVVTSRDRLDSLAVREGARRMSLDLLKPDDALAILAEWLGEDRVRDEISAADDLVRLCAHLPMAVGIAAARVALNPQTPLRTLVGELVDARQLLDRFGSQDDVDLRTIFHWSYTLLSAEAAELFRLIAEHPGPWIDGHGCAALLGTAMPPMSLLAALTSCHLLMEGPPGRFGFHDLLRAYAAELAAADDEVRRWEAVERLLAYYVAVARAAHHLIQPCKAIDIPPADYSGPTPYLAGHDEALAWFEGEITAILELLRLATAQGFDAQVWRLARASTVFLRRTGRRSERVNVQEMAVVGAGRCGDPSAHATALRHLADARARLGETGEALALLDDALTEFRGFGDRSGLLETHLSFVRVHGATGDNVTALVHAQSALELAEDGGTALELAGGLISVGRQQAHLGRFGSAAILARRAWELYLGLGHVEGEADATMLLGDVEEGLGHLEAAIDRYQAALRLDRALGDRLWEAVALGRLAVLYAASGKAEAAAVHRGSARARFEALHHPAADDFRPRP